MDYHVFLLSRVRELYDRGMSTEDAVTEAVKSTSGTITSATIIRGVLLPATMKLLGERNWWLPRSLRWLPRVRHEPEVAPARA